ncbi:MAG TPA: FAD-dependent oxidoreductase [Streptosporangiaceae bacterium]|nr:FAD-dependent oxidoreductase [Streptosporangiaceae bacterium]
MTAANHDVFVIGAGVCGLSVALVLLDEGLTVTVYAADPPHRSTSAAAGALWGAHLVGANDLVPSWGDSTLTRLRELAADPATGVRETTGLAASPDEAAGRPGFADGLRDLVPAESASLPAGYRTGWRYRAPTVAMPEYLDFLVGEVVSRGGTVTIGKPLKSLAQAEQVSTAPVIVNCAGIGARELADDDDLIPVRGQVVVVANPGLTDFFVGDGEEPGHLTYIFPHGATAVLGGTEQHGNASRQADAATAGRILRSCARVEPRLADAVVLTHRVGLRPVRPQVRLDTELLPGGRHVVHNYGHGGAGVTLSWGCAQSVRDEVLALLR